jgi:hypothetical protein
VIVLTVFVIGTPLIMNLEEPKCVRLLSKEILYVAI